MEKKIVQLVEYSTASELRAKIVQLVEFEIRLEYNLYGLRRGEKVELEAF